MAARVKALPQAEQFISIQERVAPEPLERVAPCNSILEPVEQMALVER